MCVQASFDRKKHFDWSSFNTLQLRVRGDGRPWMINIATETYFSHQKDDIYSYFLYTRGGPYWQDVKVWSQRLKTCFAKYFVESRFKSIRSFSMIHFSRRSRSQSSFSAIAAGSTTVSTPSGWTRWASDVWGSGKHSSFGSKQMSTLAGEYHWFNPWRQSRRSVSVGNWLYRRLQRQCPHRGVCIRELQEESWSLTHSVLDGL